MSSPSSTVFISLEITVSALLVFEVFLRMMAFKRVSDVTPLERGGCCSNQAVLIQRFWTKWCNIFDVVALGEPRSSMLVELFLG